jgi:hypothetical protein
MRHALLALVLTIAVGALFASTAAASEHQTSCPNGMFGLAVPQTEAELRQLPRIAAGLDADPAPYTVAELIELGNFIDGNDDGMFCLKAISNLSGNSDSQWGFFYLGRDNDTGAAEK